MTVGIDQAGPVRADERIDVARLAAFLAEHLGEETGGLTVEQFPKGYSNLTYLLKFGSRELVLRRPPFGNPVKSAHDMSREYRVLERLSRVYPMAPRPYLSCQDKSIIGDEFYVMERRRGIILRGPAAPPPLNSNPELAGRLSETFIDTLAQLHCIDYQAAGLGDLGRPKGYVARQVEGWSKRYANARTDKLTNIEALAAWLSDHQPADRGAALIHNDFKYDNLILDSHDLTQVVAVLDWEMATLGDPLMDLGTTLAYWVEPTDSDALRAQAFGPTAVQGSLKRHELVARYVDRTGFDAPNVLYYYCFGLFKLAVIVQQIYARYVRGHTSDKRFGQLNRIVETLGDVGIKAIRTNQF